jgi:hypothetical protein
MFDERALVKFGTLKRANESIAENPGNNLKMLAFLAKDW